MLEFLPFNKKKFRFFSLKRKWNTKDIEPHETFIDNLAQKKEQELGFSRKRLEVHLSRKVLYLFLIFSLLFLFVLLVRTFQLQVVQGDYYHNIAVRNVLSISSTQISRGVIYDCNYNQLVFNSPQHSLYFRNNTNNLPSEEDIIIVSKAINQSPQQLTKIIEESAGRSISIKRNLSHEELVQVETYINNIPGFYIDSTIGRNYIDSEYFSHIIGYIGKIDQDMLNKNNIKYTIHDYVGKMGIEKFYENELTRAGDTIKIIRDAAGNIKTEEIVEFTEDGTNVVLTIDAQLQKIAGEKITQKIEEEDLRNAALVAINPHTGGIMAMHSFPAFDNNLFQSSSNKGSIEEMFSSDNISFLNRSISAAYPTGSVIKPILAIAALEEKIITPDKKIYSPGYISIPNPWNPSQVTIFRDFQAHGWRDIREAIAVSSNVYFYAIGGGYEDQEGLGVTRINNYLNLFGWNDFTGIDLPGENKGFVPNPEWKKEVFNESWRIGDTYNLSIGQGYLSATPLQMANSYAALVNGGTLYVPHIVKQVIDDDQNILKEISPQVIRENFVSPENLQIVKEGMRKTVEIGTGRSLQVLPVTVGSKTGTAQTSRAGINHSWVTAFAPYDDPEIVIAIIVENVEGVTPIATHLARDILLEYFNEDGEVKNDE